MKHKLRRTVSVNLTVLMSLFLLSFVWIVSPAFGQMSDREKELRHSVEFWENTSKNDRVLLVPLTDRMTNKQKQDWINSRSDANFRGHYVQDPKSRKYYVPVDRDAFLKNKGDQAKRLYISDSDRMKQYVVKERIPQAQREIARLQPPIPASTGEQRKKELHSLVDRHVKKWAKDLEESKKIAIDSGPNDELANLGFWATRHVKWEASKVAFGTPAARNAFMDYLGCLDRVYSSHFPSGKQIKDGKGVCLSQFRRTVP
jgi:archaellum component FlaF (FlaF/FlaG flagellin family)